ncbi:DUF4062 domain-containing protein [Thalassolituus sp. LLYu03]|uniref:DUF4062 domain-containing protein n=1 Tax=Thalassolituus sp. LLYu03 TaxID=3421656 RepID=UPI003D265745
MSSTPEQKRYMVYLASNFDGLSLERYEMERQLARHNMINVGFSCREDAGPYDWNLVRAQIEIADLFILLIGDTYGPMAPTGISYLHREFVHAKSLNKPTLAFIKNSLPEKHVTEDQRRLAGFHRIVVQQSPYKLWHLREELMTHVRASLSSPSLSVGPGWLPANVPQPAPVSQPVQAAPAAGLSASQRLAKSRQLVNMQITAKVYQGGNLSLEEVLLPARMDQLLIGISSVLKTGASEDRLRAHLEGVIAPTVKTQLLKRHQQAHAVDDIRISRGQFQQMLRQWQELGYADAQGDGARAVWRLTASQA